MASPYFRIKKKSEPISRVLFTVACDVAIHLGRQLLADV